MKTSRMNQNSALSDAQPQPFASSRPKNARPRVCVVPGCRACCAIVLHPTGRWLRPALQRWVLLLDLEAALHRRGVDLAEVGVRPGLERRHGVGLLRGTG